MAILVSGFAEMETKYRGHFGVEDTSGQGGDGDKEERRKPKLLEYMKQLRGKSTLQPQKYINLGAITADI